MLLEVGLVRRVRPRTAGRSEVLGRRAVDGVGGARAIKGIGALVECLQESQVCPVECGTVVAPRLPRRIGLGGCKDSLGEEESCAGHAARVPELRRLAHWPRSTTSF